MTCRFEHATLGALIGVQTSEKTIQFRNIPYAKPVQRWRHSQPLNTLPCTTDEPYDATQWGPCCPQSYDSVLFDFALIQKELSLSERRPGSSEDGCLNLVVTRPTGDIKDLPVMVFIHGGGFMIGCNAWPQYDLEQLVYHSVNVGKPIVAVGINYRLGILGFLPNSDPSFPGDEGNYGLLDQATALKWIQKHIAGFGGDQSNVTVFGESAGSISISLHLLRGEPLFHRAICMSGDATLRRPLSTKTLETILTQPLVESLGLSRLSPTEIWANLRDTPWRTLVNSPYNKRINPTISQGFVSLEAESVDYGVQVRKHFSWCRGLMAGDCAQDASVYYLSPQEGSSTKHFVTVLGAFLTIDEVDALLTMYDIQIEDGREYTTPIHPGIVQFTSDVRFYLPTVKVSDAATQDVDLQVYHFHEANPFRGPFAGYATHVLDIAYVLQNYNRFLPERSVALARHMATVFIDFAHASLERDVVDTTGTAERVTMVWDSKYTERLMSATNYDSQMRKSAAILLKTIGVEKCVRALNRFQYNI